ncbi:MAG: hypothetical protein U5L72_04070 [Bacteroidales bacterium]|nr:hypothetical protein [Bacteroidales bacterium]
MIASPMPGFANPGFGIEVGAEYRFNDHVLPSSAALTGSGLHQVEERYGLRFIITESFRFNRLTTAGCIR